MSVTVDLPARASGPIHHFEDRSSVRTVLAWTIVLALASFSLPLPWLDFVWPELSYTPGVRAGIIGLVACLSLPIIAILREVDRTFVEIDTAAGELRLATRTLVPLEVRRTIPLDEIVAIETETLAPAAPGDEYVPLPRMVVRLVSGEMVALSVARAASDARANAAHVAEVRARAEAISAILADWRTARA